MCFGGVLGLAVLCPLAQALVEGGAPLGFCGRNGRSGCLCGLCALVLDVAGRLRVGRGGGALGLALSLLGFAPLTGLTALALFAGFA